jgi:hypothetical protein
MDIQRLAAVVVLTMIAAASMFSGHSDLTIEQLCTTHASASACRRI